MTTNPTPEHREQARAVINQHSSVAFLSFLGQAPFNELIELVAVALSSRDTEIREVLEGLAKQFDHAAWKGFNQSESEFEKGYKHAMGVAAKFVRESPLYAKLQPGK